MSREDLNQYKIKDLCALANIDYRLYTTKVYNREQIIEFILTPNN